MNQPFNPGDPGSVFRKNNSRNPPEGTQAFMSTPNSQTFHVCPVQRQFPCSGLSSVIQASCPKASTEILAIPRKVPGPSSPRVQTSQPSQFIRR